MQIPSKAEYRKATGPKDCDSCLFYERATSRDGFCSRWEAAVEPDYVCNAWEGDSISKKRLKVHRSK